MQKQTPQAMIANRLVSHGIITEAGAFSLGGTPFTIYIRPKANTSDIDVILACKLFQEEEKEASNAPFPIYDWTPMEIISLIVTDEILESYDIYWGCGHYVGEE